MPAAKRQPLSPEKWEEVEALYRAGQMSLRAIAERYGITEGAIRKRAKRDEWRRDLAAQVQQGIRQGLVQAGTHGGGTQPGTQSHREPEDQERFEREAIEKAVATGIEIVRQHRRTIGAGHDMVARLLSELDASTSHQDELHDMIEAGEDDAKRRAALTKAISLPQRTSVMRDLSQAMRHVINLERKAFNLDGDGDDDPDEAASKRDVRRELAKLNREQRANLRGIARALAGQPAGDDPPA